MLLVVNDFHNEHNERCMCMGTHVMPSCIENITLVGGQDSRPSSMYVSEASLDLTWLDQISLV